VSRFAWLLNLCDLGHYSSTYMPEFDGDHIGRTIIRNLLLIKGLRCLFEQDYRINRN